MFNNILVILSNGPLEDNRDANEFQILAQLFKSKDKPSVRNAKTVFLYDVDPTLLGKSDAVFQDFRSRVAYVYPDR